MLYVSAALKEALEYVSAALKEALENYKKTSKKLCNCFHNIVSNCIGIVYIWIL